MLTLVKAQVWKYKSIEDSTPVDVAENVTVLVGKNESGKTAFLEAIHKSNALDESEYSFVSDYPRKDYVKYRPQHEAKKYQRVVQLTYKVHKELANQVNTELFDGQEVIAIDSILIRDTTIGNTNTITLPYSEQVGLAALSRKFAGVENGKAVFANADSLAHVLEKIDALGLPAENPLAMFAAEWRPRAPEAGKNWGFIDGYVWRKYFQPALPQFLYFDDYKLLEGKVNLQTLQQHIDSHRLSDADETILGLLELAGTTVTELMSDEGYETGKAQLEAIGLDITAKIFEFWRQNSDLSVEFDIKTDSKEDPPFNAGPNLYIRIKNNKHGVTVPFDQRSKGFIWFFSFLVWFDSVQSRVDTDKQLVLLLDEPGLNLHALAQADFLAYIESLAQDHQIIFTTHSPFMVDGAILENVRVVEDVPKIGTRVTRDLAGSSDESIFPLQAALGYSIAQNLFIAKKNILVEGPADLILLQHMGALIESQGGRGLGDAIVVPVGGLDKLATFVALLGANKLKIAVLHDKASGPHQKLDDLIRQKLIEKKRVLDFSIFIEPQPGEADIEDLLPVALYVEAFNDAYRKELAGTTLDAAELGTHPRMVEHINLWLKSKGITLLKDGGFNHYRVAQAVLSKLTTDRLTADDIKRFEQLFGRIQEVL